MRFWALTSPYPNTAFSQIDCPRVWHPGDSVLSHFLYGSVIALLMRWEFSLKKTWGLT
jgi:hypothetical protein